MDRKPAMDGSVTIGILATASFALSRRIVRGKPTNSAYASPAGCLSGTSILSLIPVTVTCFGRLTGWLRR